MKSIACLPFVVSIAYAAQIKGMLNKNEIPSSGKDWITLDNGVEFQPGEEVDPRIEHVRKLWGSNKQTDEPVFVDGTETYYDEYAQAWRLLGFYIDCNYCEGADGNNEVTCVEEGKDTTCQRFLLWAAYVDLDYSGNGAGEYMYYDRVHKKWNNAACKESGSNRCVRMDCHEPTSHYKLLGTFKEPDYGTFLEQLFQYQGDCIWTDEEYKQMQGNLNAWPQECTQSQSGIYYHIKPESGGSMGIGLYSDELCSEEYVGDVSVEDVLSQEGNNDDNGDSADGLYDNIESWNSAFDAFKLCQPCKASNLVSVVNKDAAVNADGDRYQHMDDDENAYTCQDYGGDSVNQCAIFQANTNMFTASYRDIILAEEQGTVGSLSISGVNYGISEREENRMWQRNFLSALFMMACFCLFVCALVRCQNEYEDSDLNRPLVNQRSSNKSTNNSNKTRNSSR